MIQFMLGLLGLGIGLTSATSVSGGLFSLAGLWAVFIVLIGVFAGAYAAARFAGIPSRIDGMLHGIVTWAVAGLFALYLLTSGAASLVGGAFGVLGQSIDEMSTAAKALAPDAGGATDPIKGSGDLLFAPPPVAEDAAVSGSAPTTQQTSSQPERDAVLAEVSAAISAPDDTALRAAAVDAIARTAGVARAEAERRFTVYAERAGQARAEMEAHRTAAAGALARASLAAFVAMLLGMMVGALGGMLGRPGRVASEKSTRH